MTTQEQEILDKLERVLPKLSEKKKDRLMGAADMLVMMYEGPEPNSSNSPVKKPA
jgi:hypothetical protein